MSFAANLNEQDRYEARIRVQISAAHDREHLDRACEAFGRVGRALGVL